MQKRLPQREFLARQCRLVSNLRCHRKYNCHCPPGLRPSRHPMNSTRSHSHQTRRGSRTVLENQIRRASVELSAALAWWELIVVHWSRPGSLSAVPASAWMFHMRQARRAGLSRRLIEPRRPSHTYQIKDGIPPQKLTKKTVHLSSTETGHRLNEISPSLA